MLLCSDQDAVADNGARLPSARRSISPSVIYDGGKGGLQMTTLAL
jgi:hypothetical protein